ncbi:hypothetical protein Taro_027086 [Colocasia esculenta]|uniref:Histone-lysine N-methyltransferase, H3 lysine-9 specific SUVH6 n=1 Tax=Colocasia esculenta TaxID=4460 RepID=A0A843VQL4_COLES|nr:hypothetical protein [Colocasia esculenta]
MVPAMLDIGVEVMPGRYKRRSISAIRNFPPGCGRDAPLLAGGPGPAELSVPETPLVNGTVVPETVLDPTQEAKDVAGHSESLKHERVDVDGVVDQVGVAESQRRIMVNGTAEQLPVDASKAEADELPGPSGSAKSEKAYDQPPANRNHVEADDLSKSANETCAAKEELEKVNDIGLEVVKELSKDHLVLPNFLDGFDSGVSKLYGLSKKRMVSVIRHFPSGCGRSAAPMIGEDCPISPAALSNGSAVSEKPTGEQRRTIVKANKQVCGTVEDDVGREHQENMSKTSMDLGAMEESRGKKIPAEEVCKKQEHVQEYGRDVSSHFPGISKETITVEPGKDTSVAFMGLEDSCKVDQGVYKQDLAKHLPEVDLEKVSKEEHLRKKAARRPANKQVDKKMRSIKNRENETPDVDSKIQSQPCIVVKEGTESKGDFAKMSKEKNSKSGSWKHLEMVEEGNSRNADALGEKSMSLDLCTDAIIVLALMAAPNCPWRQGRQMGLVSRKTTSGNNTKKEASIPKRKSLTLEASSTQGNNAKKGVRIPKKKRLSFEMTFPQPVNKSEDGEDLLLEDVGNERALVIYPDAQEQSVSLIPFGPSHMNHDGGNEEAAIRIRVRKVLRLFQVLCRKLLQCEESKPKNQGQKIRVDLIASGILKEKNEWVNTGKPIVGSVPGVEIGDEFHYRAELSVVGLHRPYQGGIDFSRIGGVQLAISIVASVGHADEMDSSDVLIYSGSGGNAAEGDKPAQDQKLERGNLSLKNCIDAKTPVRVIRGIKELRSSGAQDGKPKTFSTFTYDGLYLVEDHWLQQGPQGFSVYKFKLKRIPGQPELALKEIKRAKRSAVREGLCIADISEGKEKIPISVVNTVDDERPAHFEYVTKMIYPSWYKKTPSDGCLCKKRCSDSEKCACAVKNGGEIPFNFNGAIVQAKGLVYECGPSCSCAPSCHNRVSQHGIKVRLEIFKTKLRGWGVRSLSSIPSGSFICEYIGELIEDKEAEQRSNDEYLFDIGHNYDDHDLWEGLPNLMPDSDSSSHSKDEREDHETGFTIDAAKYGNVGRFINHSCSPNLYAQNVLYDHDNKKMPHIMFFAAENIPPLQELTYHYNYTIDQVRDSEGNIKEKACHCGSHECTGRLY